MEILSLQMYLDNKYWKEPLKSEDPQTKILICIILPLMAFIYLFIYFMSTWLVIQKNLLDKPYSDKSNVN